MIVVVVSYTWYLAKTFLRYKLHWEMVKEVTGYFKFYHLVNKNERFSTTLLMRPKKTGDELSFIFFCFISTFSWDEKEELVKKSSHTSIVFIFGDYQDYLCPHSDRISPQTWQWWWSLLYLYSNTPPPPYIDLIHPVQQEDTVTSAPARLSNHL